jgi:RNA-binding protein NOB1
LIIDSGAFIAGAKLDNHGAHITYYTINDVVNELRDPKARHLFETFPYKITERSVSSEAIKLVTEFARSTGDLFSLSATDLRVIALTWMLEKEKHGTIHLRTEPVSITMMTCCTFILS